MVSVSLPNSMSEVESVLKHPDVWPGWSENAPTDTPLPDILYLLALDNNDIAGVFNFNTLYEGVEVHAGFLPKYRGQFAVDAAKAMFDWIYSNTDYTAIYSSISIHRPEVMKYASLTGMVKEEVLYRHDRIA